MSKDIVRAVMRNIGYFTQLGLSIACPMVICTIGALKLAEKYSLGPWAIALGVLIGLLAGVSSFISFARAMVRRSNRKDDE